MKTWKRVVLAIHLATALGVIPCLITGVKPDILFTVLYIIVLIPVFGILPELLKNGGGLTIDTYKNIDIKIGDMCFIFVGNIVAKVQISGITIGRKGYSVECTRPSGNVAPAWVHSSKVFKTKEELIKTL